MSRFAELPDGRRLEFPDDTSDEVIQETVKRVIGQTQAPPATDQITPDEILAEPEADRNPTLAERFPDLSSHGGQAASSEVGLALGTGIVAEPVSGIAGLLASGAGFVGGLVPGGESPKEKALRFGTGTIDAVREGMTYKPRTRLGAAGVEMVGEGAEFVTEQVRKPVAGIAGLLQLPFGGVEGATETIRRTTEEGIGPTAGSFAEELGAPPSVSAVIETAPTGLATVAGVKAPIRRAPRTAEPGPSIIKADVIMPEGPAVSVGRPRMDEPVDMTPPVDSATVVNNLKKGKIDKLAADVVPDVKVVEAAQRLGVDLNVEHYATSIAFQDVARAIKAKPGSGLLVSEVTALRNLATKADELVTEIGGSIDKGAVSDDIMNSTRSTIDDLQTQANVAYESVREAIPAQTRIQTSDITEFLDARLADLGGDATLLSTVERRLLKVIERGEDGTITYGALDRVRRDVGEGFGARSGPFANDSQRVLREVYDVLSKTQNGVADAFGVGEVYTGARTLVATRKALEDQAVTMFGRDAAGSLVPKIRAAATALPKGDVTAFNKLMDSLPKSRRSEVAATVLGDLFAAGSRQGGQLGTGFATTWRNLNRNKSAKDTLLRHLPKEARQRFDDIGRVMNAIVRSNDKSLANPSGSAGPIIAALEQGTLATKLYGAGQVLAGEATVGAIGGIPGLATVLRATTGRGKVNTTRVAAADGLLTSQTFKDAVQAAIEGNVVRANRMVADRPQFKRWADTLTGDDAARLARIGFIGFVSSQLDEKDRDKAREGDEKQLTELDATVKELDTVVSGSATDIDEGRLAELQSDGLIKILENGTVQVLPRARRRLNEQRHSLDQMRTEDQAKRLGMDDAEASVIAAADQVKAEPANISVNVNDIGPTEKQKKAGNYRLGHAKVQGLNISIENPVGSVRRGVNKDGDPWSSEIKSHYGYIRGTVGKDKDHLDVFIGPEPSNEHVYVVNQKKNPDKPLTEGNFDEHKILIGFHSEDSARDGYLENYEKDWKGLGSIEPVTMSGLKDWMRSGNTKTIFAQDHQAAKLPGKEKLSVVQNFNKAGYPAMATLVKSLPVKPDAEFMGKLNA